jgi:oligoendopeptidase F
MELASEVQRVPVRGEVAENDRWDLRPLYADDAAWEADLARVDGLVRAVAAHRGRLAESSDTLRAALEAWRALQLVIERLFHFASLRVAEDGADDAAQGREARVRDVATRAAAELAFVDPELLGMDDATWERVTGGAGLEEWANWLRRVRRYKPHTLGEREERLLAMVEEPLAASDAIFGQLTDVDLTFGTLKDGKGRERELSQGSFSSFLVDREPSVRKAAFHQFYAGIGSHKHTLATALAHSVKADVFRARARGYGSAREAALFHDDVPVSVYDNLVAAVRSRLPVLHEYYELRRRVLGLGEIHHYDTYVPMVGAVETDYTYEQAVDVVLAALEPLGAEYVGVLGRGLREGRWCDRYENKGKRSGAFSSGSYGNPPYLLMNYKRDVFSEVYTLAHEAGHSMHTWLAQRAQPYQDHHYAIFVAEVASTFNESLLTHHLLAETDDRAMRAYIINRQIDDLRGTLFRQTMFAEFETRVHAMQEAGEGLTMQAFRSEYRRLLDAYFGGKFAVDGDLELECLRIPHFYSAFYVYKYATGLSAAIALSRRVLDGGGAEREQYLRFLSTGGAALPLEALRTAGVDMTRPEPVDAALDLFERRVGELRELLT